MKINFILTGEGSSDLRLVEHIENILILEGFSEVSGEAPDLGMFKPKTGRAVREKLNTLLKYYPNVDAIFIHRDADNAGRDAREQEIFSATDGIVGIDRVVPIIPVSMLETWLLTDSEELKRVAGNSGYRNKLQSVPPIRQLESIADTKQLLLDALCEASQTQGGRLKRFKGRFSEMRARLTFDLDPGGSVNNLSSYKYFREKVREFSQTKLAGTNE
jgi:hypothetical protein